MQEAKLNTAPGNPVIAAQINLEQNFAFIEVHCYGLVSFFGYLFVCWHLCILYDWDHRYMYQWFEIEVVISQK